MSQYGAAKYNGSLPILGRNSRVQEQQLDGPVQKYEEGEEAVGDGGKGTGEYGSDGTGTGNDVQGVSSESATLREWELGIDGDNAESDGGVPSLAGTEDIRDFSLENKVGGVGVVIGDRCLGGDDDLAYEIVHSETEG